MFDAIAKYRDRVKMDHILPKTKWHPTALRTSAEPIEAVTS
jgi:hypothetical protein